jgi:fatty acid desaturase
MLSIMDHKAFISTLPANTRALLSQTEDRAGLRHLAGHIGLILMLGLWIGLGWPLWWVMLPLQGIALCFLFTLEHEATHKTPFRSQWLNEGVGRICGVVLILPFEWFRYFHLAHHRFTNIPGKDPELLTGMKPETPLAYVIHISGLPFWSAMIKQTLGNALGRDPGAYIPAGARPRVMAEARLMLALYALAGLSLYYTHLLLWLWIIPLLLGQPFLRLYLLAEHGRCAFVADMFENTRTTYTTRLVRFLAWNMPYHVEHHTLPNVPFHRLPDLHDHLQQHLRVTANGYGAFTVDYIHHLKQP